MNNLLPVNVFILKCQLTNDMELFKLLEIGP